MAFAPPVAIDLFDARWFFVVVDFAWKQAGLVEIERRIEMFGAEGIEALGVVLRDVGIAERFADGGSVFGFDQGIVITLVGTAFGELDVQFFKQMCDLVADVFTSVVGMKDHDVKRKLFNHLGDEWEYEGLGDGLD